MAAITDLSDIINRLTGGNSGTPQHAFTWIDNRVAGNAANATVAGRMTSLWRYNKNPGGSGAAPTTWANPDNTTAGGLMHTDPSGGRQLWFLGLEGFSTQSGTLVLYDRLGHIGNLNGTTTTAQTFTGSLTRYNTNSTCIGNMLFVEIYAAIGATLTTATIKYTNQAGTNTQVTPTFAIGGTGLNEAQRMIPVPLADGDTGVQAVGDLDLVASTLTAGSFGVTVGRPILILPISANATTLRDTIARLPSLPEIPADACLTWAFHANTTTAPQFFLGHHFIEK